MSKAQRSVQPAPAKKPTPHFGTMEEAARAITQATPAEMRTAMAAADSRYDHIKPIQLKQK